MKRISEFIKELESLKEQHGDLPVVTNDPDYGESIDNNDSYAIFKQKHAFEPSEIKYKDCIVIC